MAAFIQSSYSSRVCRIVQVHKSTITHVKSLGPRKHRAFLQKRLVKSSFSSTLQDLIREKEREKREKREKEREERERERRERKREKRGKEREERERERKREKERERERRERKRERKREHM